MGWMEILQNFGLTVCILIFLGWCLIGAAHWAAPRVDKWVDRQMQAADKMLACETRLDKLESRFETLWEFQLRRATIEALSKGVGKMNSPLVITEEAKSWLIELAPELQQFWREVGHAMTTAQAAEEIERRWGDEIVKRVCAPHEVHHGACLLIALAVAQDVSPVIDTEVNKA